MATVMVIIAASGCRQPAALTVATTHKTPAITPTTKALSMCSNSSQKSGKRQQFTNCNGNGTKSIKIGKAKGEKKRQSKKQNKTKIYKKATKTLKAQAQGRRKIDIRKKKH